VDGALNLTVCNRSNDVVWGMVGANIVHMTMLQELIALAVGVPVGKYYVMTNNAHVYQDLPDVSRMLKTERAHRNYYEGVPLLAEGETYTDFRIDCESFLQGRDFYSTNWMNTVAAPMRDLYLARKRGEPVSEDCIAAIADKGWRIAAFEWIAAKTN
jgi:hypothetical protein